MRRLRAHTKPMLILRSTDNYNKFLILLKSEIDYLRGNSSIRIDEMNAVLRNFYPSPRYRRQLTLFRTWIDNERERLLIDVERKMKNENVIIDCLRDRGRKAILTRYVTSIKNLMSLHGLTFSQVIETKKKDIAIDAHRICHYSLSPQLYEHVRYMLRSNMETLRAACVGA